MCSLQRPEPPMPHDMADALDETGLRGAYDARPEQQRAEYIAWIERAVRPEIRARRMKQMLDELARGGTYMGTAWQPRRDT